MQVRTKSFIPGTTTAVARVCYPIGMTDEDNQEIRELNRCVAGMRHYIGVAAKYKNDDPVALIAGIQAALGKAAEYDPTRRAGKRRGRRDG